MREIKFRAFVKGEMKYNVCLNMWGNYFHKVNTPECIAYVDVPVMQFTGLKDKNGKEIYEGDVVVNKDEPCKECESNKREFGAVSWHEMGYWVVGTSGLQLSYNISNVNKGKIPNQFNYLEIIGNIYENPELLNK